MTDLVSVVIPTYNREKLISRAIKSVLNQTYSNLEVLVVDDCSTDNTRSVVKSINDIRVKYVKLSKNSGACAARNEGIRLSNGKYIAFQDSDDEWLPNKLEEQIRAMKENNAKVSFCNFAKFQNEQKNYTVFPANIGNEFLDHSILIKKSICSTQCLIAEKECFNDVKFDITLPRLQDWDIIIELSKKYNVYHVDKALVNMYVQTDSISSHPEKGIIALDCIWNKNSKYLIENPEIKHLWHIYRGNYLLDNCETPTKDYKAALDIKFNKNIFIKYIMCKLHIIVPIYKTRQK